MSREEYEKFMELLVKCIASTPPEYHAELCRDFRIPPVLVEARRVLR